MNTNNVKTKTLSIGKFKIYSENGTLMVSGNGQIFNLLEGKKSIKSGGFFSTQNSEVLAFIRKIFKFGTMCFNRRFDDTNK